jgi:hypothetical protein
MHGQSSGGLELRRVESAGARVSIGNCKTMREETERVARVFRRRQASYRRQGGGSLHPERPAAGIGSNAQGTLHRAASCPRKKMTKG